MCIIDSIDRKKLDNLLNNILNYELKQINLLENLDLDKKQIILYGAGKLGDLAIDILKQIKIIPKYIIDRSPKKQGTIIEGIEIISPDSIKKDDKDKSIFAVCTVNSPFGKLYEFLKSCGCKNVVPFFDLVEPYSDILGINNGWICESISQEDKNNIVKIYKGFNDNISRALFLQVLYWRIKREEIVFENARVLVGEKFFPRDIMPQFKKDEYFVDCGAYDGYIINDFLKYCNYNFKKIVAFEPDYENYKALTKYVLSLNSNIRKKIITHNYGIGDKHRRDHFYSGLGEASRFDNKANKSFAELNTIDNILGNENITYLKIHVEGYELKVLKGALKTIEINRPIIGVTIYHDEEGLWEVPKFLMENLEDYLFYNRLHCYCGIASVLYAIPKERVV